MQYREYAPTPRLTSIVDCVWTLEGSAAELDDPVQPILPDGRPELVVHFGDAFEWLHPTGVAERQPPVIFAGQLTNALMLRPTGRIAVLGIRFQPDGAATLSTSPQSDFTGVTVDADHVSRDLARSLYELREAAPSLAEAARRVQDVIVARSDASRVDPRVRYAVQAIRRGSGIVSVDRLASSAGMTRRHLERRFRAFVGVSPKRLARITRFQRALHVLARADVPQRGAYTAAECGYADQAHFVRECHELCGHPPMAYLRERTELTGFFLD